MSAGSCAPPAAGGRWKKIALFLLKLALTAGCLWWAFSRVDLSESPLARPGSLDPWWIAGGLACALGTVLLTSLRWWVLLRAQEIHTSFWRAVELTFIGNLFSLIAFGGIGGDASRILLLIRTHPDRKLAITMTVMMDHLVGLVALALLFFGSTAGRFDALEDQSVLGKGVIHFVWVTYAGGLALTALMFVAAWPPVHRRIHGNGRQFRWEILRRMPELYDVFRRRWPYLLLSLAAGIAMLPVYFGSFWCAARALGSDVDAGSVLCAMPVVDAMSALPVSVAGIGVREKTFEVLMDDLTAMSTQIAVASSLLGFFFSLLWAFFGAALFLRPQSRIRIRDLEQSD